MVKETPRAGANQATGQEENDVSQLSTNGAALAQNGISPAPSGNGNGAATSLLRLSDEHRQRLQKSALSDQRIDALVAAGINTDTAGRLLIPYRNPDGNRLLGGDGKPWIRWRRPQVEIDRDPAGGKYRSTKGAGCRIYHPVLSPAHEKRLVNTAIPLRITEGEFKGEACAAHDPGRVTVAIGGVSSWKDRRGGQGKGEPSKALPELESIPVQGREVRLCFDSDLDKPQVRSSLEELALWLHERGAHVLLERLPNAPRRDKDGKVVRLGADDLIYGYGVTAFLRIAAIAQPCLVVANKEVVFVLPREPKGETATHERGVYATALLGREWRWDPDSRWGWWKWESPRWVAVDGHDELDSAIEEFLDCQDWQAAKAPGNVNGLRSAFRRQIGSLKPTRRPGFLPCRNGVLRLEDFALLPHDPSFGNTWALSIDWNPLALHRPVEEFLLRTLGDPGSVAIFRAAGRAALLGLREKIFLEIHGSADCGKSVVANLLVAVIGSENTASMDLHKLEDRGQRFETYKLRNKLLAIFNEADKYAGPLDNLKAITGGDRISAERKGGTANVDFYFTGLAVVVGNGPIRPADTSDGILKRRRSIYCPNPVPRNEQRQMLESTGDEGGWRGELVPYLSGFIRWLLEMDADEAREALANPIANRARADSELTTLLNTDPLAEWADGCLVYDPNAVGEAALRMGMLDDHPDQFAFPNYRQLVTGKGNEKALAHNQFKKALVSLLRDHLGIPLPPGDTGGGVYARHRTMGSAIPKLRFRNFTDGDRLGVVSQAMEDRLAEHQVHDAGPSLPGGPPDEENGGDELTTPRHPPAGGGGPRAGGPDGIPPPAPSGVTNLGDPVTNFPVEGASLSQAQTPVPKRDLGGTRDGCDGCDELSSLLHKEIKEGPLYKGWSGERPSRSSRPSPPLSLTGFWGVTESEGIVTPGLSPSRPDDPLGPKLEIPPGPPAPSSSPAAPPHMSAKIKGLDRSTAAAAPPAEETVPPANAAHQPTTTDPAWLPRASEIHRQNPCMHWSAISNQLFAEKLGSPNGAQVKAAIVGARTAAAP